jgi:hypothetical protein
MTPTTPRGASALCPSAVNIRLDGEARVFVCTLPAGHPTWHVSEDGVDWQPVLVSDKPEAKR